MASYQKNGQDRYWHWIKMEYGLEYQKAQIYNLLEKVGIAFKKKLP